MLKSSRVLVFSDFNCPFCFTLNEWLEAEGLGSMVRWVGIEHRPDLPAGGANDGKDADLMHWEVSEVQRRAPEIELSPPPLWSNSQRALLLQNAIEDDHPDLAGQLRTAIFRRYWQGGELLSREAVLEEALAEVGLPPLASHFLDDEQLTQQSTWWRQELDRVPCMISPTEARHLGLQDRQSVTSFVLGGMFEPEPGVGCQ